LYSASANPGHSLIASIFRPLTNKNRQMDTTNWTHDDYKAFALIYAASVDSEVQEEEDEMILQLIGAERTKSIRRASANLSDYEHLQLLEGERHRFYPGDDGKKQLLAEIEELFKVDGDYSQLEQVISHNLARLL